jgi:hypothetical protein
MIATDAALADNPTEEIAQQTTPPPKSVPPKKRVNAQSAQTGDFISDYAEYADVIEAPRVAHEIVAEQIVAAILNKNGVAIHPFGGAPLTLDTWQVLLSGSGFGRSTLIRLVQPILNGAGLSDLTQGSSWGSEIAAMQGFAEKPSGLLTWGEMSEQMKKLNQPNFPTLKQWITDRYDDPSVPQAVTYRKTGKRKKDTPPIEFTEAPRINILATSSEDWFFGNIMQTDSTGGWIPRWMLCSLPNAGRSIPIPKNPDPDRAVALIKSLRKINSIQGKEVDLSQARDGYEKWYHSAKARFDAQPNPSLSSPYFNRHRGHVLKLAAIYTAASTGALRVTDEAWEMAVQRAKGLEKTIFKFLPTGMSQGGYECSKMLTRIEETQDEGLTLSAFTRAFQHVESWHRENHLSTLSGAGSVSLFNRKTAGRPCAVLVAEDHVAQYLKKHPSDLPMQGDIRVILRGR